MWSQITKQGVHKAQWKHKQLWIDSQMLFWHKTGDLWTYAVVPVTSQEIFHLAVVVALCSGLQKVEKFPVLVIPKRTQVVNSLSSVSYELDYRR